MRRARWRRSSPAARRRHCSPPSPQGSDATRALDPEPVSLRCNALPPGFFFFLLELAGVGAESQACETNDWRLDLSIVLETRALRSVRGGRYGAFCFSHTGLSPTTPRAPDPRAHSLSAHRPPTTSPLSCVLYTPVSAPPSLPKRVSGLSSEGPSVRFTPLIPGRVITAWAHLTRLIIRRSAVGAAAAGARSLPASPRCEAQQLLFRTSEEDEKGAALAG